MEVSSEVFIDAEHHPVDIGYLYYLGDDVAAGLRSPPNYARYNITPYILRMSCQVNMLSTVNL